MRSALVSSVAASAAARLSWRNTEVTWSCTTRKADAMVEPDSPGPPIFCSTTTTPSWTNILPTSAWGGWADAQSRNAAWPCAAPCASPTSMSSLDRATKVSISNAFKASCQANTVAISELGIIENVPWAPRLERRVVEPVLPYGGLTEHGDIGVGDRNSPNDCQQQVDGIAAQRHCALVVTVGPRDAVLVGADGPFTGSPQTGIGGVQMHGLAVFQRQRCVDASCLSRDPLKPFADSIGCQLGCDRIVEPERERGVGPMHGRLVQATPQPPVRRPRAQKRPHR